MMKLTRNAAAVLAAAAVAACGGGSGEQQPAPPCTPPGTGFDPAHPPQHLSDLSLLVPSPGAVTPKAGVIPYDLNTPLFSDYAQKTRLVYVPPGSSAAYDAVASLDLPVGTIVAKTFALAPDQRSPATGRKLVETRLLVHTADGWKGYPYVWNDAETEATYTPGGRKTQMPMVTPSGTSVTADYLVPSQSQCSQCHEDHNPGDAGSLPMHLLGPTARNLNRDYDYATGTQNQLDAWTAAGILTGAPPSADAPKLVAAHDPASGTVEERARAWLEVNCAFCHSTTGLAYTSGLHLGTAVTDPYELGICKPPVAAGPGTGGRLHDIVPGSPDDSILVYRVEARWDDPDLPNFDQAVMPPLGRTVRSEEGVALVRQWISDMTPTPCAP